MHAFKGACHCGNLTVEYLTAIPAAAAAVRACQCTFCRKHDARAVSDPGGRITITAKDPGRLLRYRFGLEVTDYLICGQCGVYVSAYTQQGGEAYANVMVNVLDDRAAFPTPRPVDLDGEDANGKWQRRRENWTPAVLITTAG